MILFYWNHSEGQVNIQLTDKGVLLDKESAVKLDYWSRKGLACQSALDYTLELLNQIRKANLESDSLQIIMQRNLYIVKNETQIEREQKSVLLGKNQQLESQIVILTKENKKLQRQVFTSYTIGFLIFIGTIFILK